MPNNFLQKVGKNISDFVYKNFENGSGKMILLTSMVGIGLSTLAQTGAIILNDKYTTSQKAFLIPQELTDGCITIASIFLITRPLQNIAVKSIKTGKITTTEIKNYMEKYKLADKRGSLSFDFRKNVDNIINSIEKSDKFIRSGSIEKKSMLAEHKDIIQNYNQLSDASSAIASTMGSVISIAAVSPFLRNYSASYSQKASLSKKENIPDFYKETNCNKTKTTCNPNPAYFNPCNL